VIAIAENLVGVVSGTGGIAAALAVEDLVQTIGRGPIGVPTLAELAAKLGVDEAEALDLVLEGMDAGEVEVWDASEWFCDDAPGVVVTLSLATAGRLGLELVDVDHKGRYCPWRWARAGASRRRGTPLNKILTDDDGKDLLTEQEYAVRVAPDPRPGSVKALLAVEEREQAGILLEGEARVIGGGRIDRAMRKYLDDSRSIEWEPRPIHLLGLSTPHWPIAPDAHGFCPVCRGKKLGPMVTCLVCNDRRVLPKHVGPRPPEPPRRVQANGRLLAGSIEPKGRGGAGKGRERLKGGLGPVRPVTNSSLSSREP
jgi:hypothetical protein